MFNAMKGRTSLTAQSRMARTALSVGIAASFVMISPTDTKSGAYDEIRELAGQIAARSIAADKTTIAISSFPHMDGTCSELSNFLVDELVLGLFSLPDHQLSIIERSQLDRIFSELELSLSGAVDVNTTQELGRVHGVETLLVGAISTIGDNLRFNARLIDTETAQVYSAAAVNIPQTSTFEEFMERPAAGGCTMKPHAAEDDTARRTQGNGRGTTPFDVGIRDIDGNFEMAALVGRWRGLRICEDTTHSRQMWLRNPTPTSLEVRYYYGALTTGTRAADTTLAFDMSGGSVGNRFLLNLGERGIPLQLIAQDVLYGEPSSGGQDCTLYFGKYE